MKAKKIFKIMIIVILCLIIIDQLSKVLVDKFIESEMNCISNVLVITKIENEGIAFGLNKRKL